MFSEKSVLSKLILPILMILFLLGLAGCGNKAGSNGSASVGSTSPAPANSQNAKLGSSTATAATTATKAGVVTYENYLKIKLDTTYDDVKSILGEGQKNTINADIVSYRWNDQGKTITIRTNKGKVETKTQNKLGKTTSKLTVDQFNQVTKGMTIDQVVSILGPDYREASYNKSATSIIRSVVWMMPDSTYIKVTLKDDKVTNKYSTFEATTNK